MNCCRLSAMSICAAEAGQDQRLFSGDQVGAVQLGGDMRGQLAPASACAVNSVSGVAERKFPPMAKNTFASPCVHGLDRVHDIEAMCAGRLETKLLRQFVEEGVGRFFPDAHGAVALDVGVAAHRDRPAPGRPMLPRSRRKLTISWIVADGAAAAASSPCPAHDDRLRRIATSAISPNLLATRRQLVLEISSHETLRARDGILRSHWSSAR